MLSWVVVATAKPNIFFSTENSVEVLDTNYIFKQSIVSFDVNDKFVAIATKDAIYICTYSLDCYVRYKFNDIQALKLVEDTVVIAIHNFVFKCYIKQTGCNVIFTNNNNTIVGIDTDNKNLYINILETKSKILQCRLDQINNCSVALTRPDVLTSFIYYYNAFFLLNEKSQLFKCTKTCNSITTTLTLITGIDIYNDLYVLNNKTQLYQYIFIADDWIEFNKIKKEAIKFKVFEIQDSLPN